jgi:ATP-dependent RNA helicase DDX18/HAS1
LAQSPSPLSGKARRRIRVAFAAAPQFFFSVIEKFEFRDSLLNLLDAFTTSIFTMGAQEIEAKKRKRKHSSKKSEDAAAPKRHSNGVEKAEKPRKKAKKEHTPEPEVEDDVAEASDEEPEEEVEGEEDEAKLNDELKQIAKQAKKSKKAEAEESGDEQESANPNDLPLGTSMPTVEDPKLFSELKLSDRTMEAIKSMGFETMTEIQQKTIPPLLR